MMDDIVSLAKRRGFVYPSSEIYGGLANSWDFGPLGVELKNNIKQLWWTINVHQHSDIYGLDAGILMNRKVWKASGHEEDFNDPLVECKKCHKRFRHNELKKSSCPSCGGTLTKPQQFNMMFRTHAGAVEDDSNLVYLRPETAQGIFVDFKRVVDSFSPKLPFGIAQIGKAFRNEITPGNFIFRTREFEQMEIEYFVRKQEWEKWFAYWEKEMKKWTKAIGLNAKAVHFIEVPAKKRAHYSKKTVDIEFDFPFGRKELYGLAYRGDFDLKAHQTESGESLVFTDPKTNEKMIPHVIEPSLGVERTMLAVLISAYKQDSKRTWLKLPVALAPYKAAVFPLVRNKPKLTKKARSVFEQLLGSSLGPVAWDDRGNIGKRYMVQDEIGTPSCITIDYDTLEDDTVTVRDRNTTKQERVKISELEVFLSEQHKK